MPVGMQGESRTNQINPSQNTKTEAEQLFKQEMQKQQQQQQAQHTADSRKPSSFVQNVLDASNPAKLGMGLIAQSWGKLSQDLFAKSADVMEKNINAAMESEISALLVGSESQEDSVQLSKDRLESQKKEGKAQQASAFSKNGITDPGTPKMAQAAVQAAVGQKKGKSDFDSDSADSQTNRSTSDTVDTHQADDAARSERRQAESQKTATQQAQSLSQLAQPHAQTREIAQGFVQAFTKKALGDTKTDSHELNDMRSSLIASGISEKQVHDLEARVLANARRNIETQLKDHILKQMLSREGTMEIIKHTKQANAFVANAILKNAKLGGFDYGGRHGGMAGMGAEVRAEARAELRDFFTEEFRAAVIRGTMGEDAHAKALAQLTEMKEFAQRVGFNFKQWSQRLPEEKVHLGLVVKDWEGALDRHHLGKDGQGQQQRTAKPIEPPVSEEAILTETVIALYVRLNIDRSIRNRLRSMRELSVLKKKMKERGMDVSAILAKAEADATAVSKLKLLELLKELYAHRATLVELSGPTFDGISKQIDNYQKALRRLGHELSELEVKSMKDEANMQVFQISKNELMELQIKLKMQPANIFLMRKRQQVIRNLERLKAESNIAENIKFDLGEQTIDFGQNSSIHRDA